MMKQFNLGTIILLLALGPAAAADAPRRIDFTSPIIDQDNEPMTECADNPLPKDDRDCKARRVITLGMVALRALTVPEQGLSGEEGLKRGQLALMVYRSPGAELTAEEVSLIKKQIAKFYSSLVIARAFPMLDPATAAGR
jgi:hypothetical protein